MATYTNTAPGMRGINHKDGSTTWVEPGESIEATDVAHAHDDLVTGKPPKSAPDAEPAA